MMLKSTSPSSYTRVAGPVVRRGASGNWKKRFEAPKQDKIAHLLLKAGLLNQEHLVEAEEIALSISATLDHVLISSYLPSGLARLAAKAMQYVERGIISDELAINGLAVANYKRTSLEEGLRYFGFGW